LREKGEKEDAEDSGETEDSRETEDSKGAEDTKGAKGPRGSGRTYGKWAYVRPDPFSCLVGRVMTLQVLHT
jgi:hypothetical protein